MSLDICLCCPHMYTFVFVYHTHVKKLFCLIIIDKTLTIKVAGVIIFILQLGFASGFNLNFLQDS